MLPTQYQTYIHKSRYARWRDDLSRRETWEETVLRYINFWKNKNLITPEDAEILFGAIYNLKVVPSMRCLMTAGKALEIDNVAGFNCFAGDQSFLTNNGPKTFTQTVNTWQKVLNKDGNWVDAQIKSFGLQPVQEITFRPTNKTGLGKTSIRHSVVATPNHRWLTLNRGEVTDLRIGDVVPFTGAPQPKFIAEAWIRGFGFGDGTIDQRGRARLRLCGAKNKWRDQFETFGHCTLMSPPSFKGDTLIIFNANQFTNWKQLPEDRYNDPEYLANWIEGYLAADGHANPAQPGLSSQNEEAIDFVTEIAALAGYHVTGHNISTNAKTNLGVRSAPLHRITLRKEGAFKVETIDQIADPEEVFCAVVPDTHTFTLSQGILTGNCSYTAIDSPKKFDEILYILMCGTGVGFSVERQFTNKLPEIPETLYPTDTTIVVPDSKIGWATSLRELISLLYAGKIPSWDTSRIRPSGARLKTFGGRASGPKPLEDVFKFTIQTFKKAAGRKLTSIECHDLVCKIAECVVVGGVRRSALISLSNLSDDRMRHAKSGQWWSTEPQRSLANNSVCYTERPEIGIFMQEWLSLYESKSGERGIFNREAAQKLLPERRKEAGYTDFGTNPCSEIVLRSGQFCNLSEVIVRPEDTLDDLKEKVRLATILGTLQATLTDFRYLSKEWKKNTEEEALLGVSLTGIMDHPVMGLQRGHHSSELRNWLVEMRQVAVETNQEWAAKLGINPSASITCVKPSGTVSQLVDSASGIHPRYAPYYIRTVRADMKDPLAEMMVREGIPHEPDVMRPTSTWVFSFPMKAPEGSVFRDDRSAIEQLELWKTYQLHWCEHKPSITVYVKEHEWMEVGAWVWENFDIVSGVSFLPHSEHTYQQAPYQEIDQETYEKLTAHQPQIDWNKLSAFETEDQTTNTKELACTAGGCEL